MPQILFVHALSPLHAGTGQSLGAIDLAIARDRASGMPYLPGSSIKGSLRARALEDKTDENKRKTYAVFGPDTDNASEYGGALIVGDANLLAMQVRSISGTFSWVTSPLLLRKFARDAKEAGVKGFPASIPAPSSGNALHTASTVLKVGTRIVFEDLDFEAKDGAKDWADFIGTHLFKDKDDEPWKKPFVDRFCIVHDDVMAFLAEHATDVVTRISIDNDTKTVKDGALWQEENLPTESILVSLVDHVANGKAQAKDTFDLLRRLAEKPLQLGGKATVGRGRCRLVLVGGAT